MDGIAFGKNYLKRPSRPPIHIPPRKRPRLTYDDHEQFEEAEADGQRQLRILATFDNADEEVENEDDVTGSFAETELPDVGSLRSGKRRKSVSFNEDNRIYSVQEVDDEDEDEDDEGDDFEPESSDDESEESEGAAEFRKSTSHTRASNAAPSQSGDDSQSSGSESDSSSVVSSDSDSDSESSSNSSEDSESGSDSRVSNQHSFTINPTSPKAKFKSQSDKRAPRATQPSAPPNHGKARTQERNRRRSALKRLNFLKRMNRVDPSMTLTEYKLIQRESQPVDEGLELEPHLIDAGSSISSAKQEFEHRRQALLESIESGGVDVQAGLESHVGGDSREEGQSAEILDGGPYEALVANKMATDQLPQDDQSFHTAGEGQSHTHEELKKPRSRLDVNSAKRLLFGGLGVRSPRNKAEEETVRAKLAAKANPKANLYRAEGVANDKLDAIDLSGLTDPDAWKSKIRLTAVECVDADVELIAPPFPFQQRWDPQQKLKGKRRKRSGHLEEQEDFISFDGVGQEWSYENVTGGSLVDVAASFVDDSQESDLPELPFSLSELPTLTIEDIKPGAVVIFKQLEVSEETLWQPAISPFRTAVVEQFDVDSQTLCLTLARRDRAVRQHKYDETGNRIYGKFEMPEADDDDDDVADSLSRSGFLEIDLTSLVEPKLLRPGPTKQNAEGEGDTMKHLGEPSQSMIPESMIDGQGQDSMFTTDGPASNPLEGSSAQSEGGFSGTPTVKGQAGSPIAPSVEQEMESNMDSAASLAYDEVQASGSQVANLPNERGAMVLEASA